MFGVLNIYKPKGLTSHDVVGIVRKALKTKQVGHTGTLDPFAEGVLPICVGKATRLIEYFDDDKEYLAEIQLGSATDTYDLEGKITQTCDKKISQQEFENALEKFKGEISQLPPIYSAIKVNGKKLYEYARAGEEVKIEPRTVTIYKAEVKNFDETNQKAEVLIKCSKGTYIRSIANDLGENLGCFGHLTRLIRVQAGKFTVDKTVKLPVVINEESENNHSKKYTISDDTEKILADALIPPINVLSLPTIEVTPQEHEKISHGNSIKKYCEKLKSGDFLILVYNNNIDAVGQYSEVEIKIKKVFI